MKKTSHKIWKEAKELNLNDEEFKKYLKDNGVIVSKESIDKQYGIAENISRQFIQKKYYLSDKETSSGTGMSWFLLNANNPKK